MLRSGWNADLKQNSPATTEPYHNPDLSMRKNVIVRIVVCAIAVVIFVWAYFQTRTKPIAVENPPVLIVPQQPQAPARETMTAKEKEMLDKHIAETNARLEREVKAGGVPPDPGADSQPQTPPESQK